MRTLQKDNTVHEKIQKHVRTDIFQNGKEVQEGSGV